MLTWLAREHSRAGMLPAGVWAGSAQSSRSCDECDGEVSPVLGGWAGNAPWPRLAGVTRPVVGVRRAGGSDVAAMLAMLCDDRAHDGAQHPGLSRERVVQVVARPDVQVLLAEASAGRGAQPPAPVGMLVLRHGELLPLGGHPSVHVEQLWVHPDHRRRGVARALLRAAAAIGEQWGLDDVVCAVPPEGREAHRFLARLGFAPVVTQRAVPVASLLRRLTDASEPARRRISLDPVVIRRRRQQRSAARPSLTV